MKKHILIVAALMLSVLLSAQTSVWKVSKGGEHGFLAGTIHLLRPADLPLPQAFYTALDKSDVLYVEADMDKMQDPQFAQQMMMKMMLSEGKTLSSMLEEDTYKKLETECSAVGIPLAQLNSFKPSMAVMTLTAMKLMSLGVSGEGVDKTLMAKAKASGKAIKFMEDVDFQLDVLAKMGEGNEDAFVRYSLEDMHKMEDEFATMIQEWKNGSSVEMEKSSEKMKAEFPKLYQSLLLDRNNDWLAKLPPLFSNDEIALVAVGTLHLHGDDGLLKQLKKKGYKVEQIQ